MLVPLLWSHALFRNRVVALVALLSSACTNLQVYKVDGTTHLPDAPGSIPYALPKKSILATATYVLTQCKTTTNPVALLLDADVTINVTQANEVDESERYAIPYTELRSWIKEINFVVESYSNQTLKSFTGAINDQASAILTGAVGTAIKFGALAGVTAEKPKQDFCTDDARAALVELEAVKKRLKDIVNPPTPVKPPAKPEPGQDALIAELTKRIGEITSKALTSKVYLSWSPQVSELVTGSGGRDVAAKTVTPEKAVQKWLTPEGQTWLRSHPLKDAQTIYIVIDVPAWSHPARKEESASVTDGLILRDPAVGLLRVCKGPCATPNEAGVVSIDNVLSSAPVVVPQLGRKLVVPLRNTFAQNSSLEVTLSEDGVITKLGIKNASTLSQTATGLGSNADALKAAQDARDKAQAAAQTKTRDDNKRLADCLEAQKTIAKDGGTPISVCQ